MNVPLQGMELLSLMQLVQYKSLGGVPYSQDALVVSREDEGTHRGAVEGCGGEGPETLKEVKIWISNPLITIIVLD